MIFLGFDLYLGAPRDKGGVRVPSALGILLMLHPRVKRLMVFW